MTKELEKTIGDGVNVEETGKSVGAAGSTLSQKKGAGNTKKTKHVTTPEEAGEFLLTALKYCKEAMLTVNGYNEDSKLYLEISGLAYSNGSIFPVTQSHSKVTQPSHTVTQSVEQSHTVEKNSHTVEKAGST